MLFHLIERVVFVFIGTLIYRPINVVHLTTIRAPMYRAIERESDIDLIIKEIYLMLVCANLQEKQEAKGT